MNLRFVLNNTLLKLRPELKLFEFIFSSMFSLPFVNGSNKSPLFILKLKKQKKNHLKN